MKFLSILLALTLFLFNSVVAYANDRIFVTNEKSNTISVIDAESLTIENTMKVGVRTRGIGLSPDGNEL